MATTLPLDDGETLARAAAFTKLIEQLQFYVVACCGVFIWDILITFHLELRYVWPSRFTLVKVCFFVNRYLTLTSMVFLVACAFSPYLHKHCNKVHYLQAYLPILVFLCCNYKLVQRASSLFHKPQPIFYSLIAVVIAQAIIQAVLSIQNKPIVMPPGVIGCYSYPDAGRENYAFVYWLLPLFTQTIVLLITLGKVFQYWTTHGRSHLLDIFLRDGIHFFAVTASSNIINVVYLKSKVQIDGVSLSGGSFNSALAIIINSMMVSRLIIHMRIALAESTTITYFNEIDGKAREGKLFHQLRDKLGFPTVTRRSFRTKDHISEQGGHTTIVDLHHLDKSAGGTYNPDLRKPGTPIGSDMHGHMASQRNSGLKSAFSIDGDDMETSQDNTSDAGENDDSILPSSPTSPGNLKGRAKKGQSTMVAFNLPAGHAIGSPRIQGNAARPEPLRLNRRPQGLSGAHAGTSSGSGRGQARNGADAPVLYVGEDYHHRNETPDLPANLNLKNAIIVHTEQVVKSEGEPDASIGSAS